MQLRDIPAFQCFAAAVTWLFVKVLGMQLPENIQTQPGMELCQSRSCADATSFQFSAADVAGTH
jgi:hypothetical protein